MAQVTGSSHRLFPESQAHCNMAASMSATRSANRMSAIARDQYEVMRRLDKIEAIIDSIVYKFDKFASMRMNSTDTELAHRVDKLELLSFRASVFDVETSGYELSKVQKAGPPLKAVPLTSISSGNVSDDSKDTYGIPLYEIAKKNGIPLDVSFASLGTSPPCGTVFYNIFDGDTGTEKGDAQDFAKSPYDELTVANEHFMCYASDPESNIDKDRRAPLNYKKAARNAAS